MTKWVSIFFLQLVLNEKIQPVPNCGPGSWWSLGHTDRSQCDRAQREELQGSRVDAFQVSPSPGSLDQPWAEDFSCLSVKAPSQSLGPGNEIGQSWRRQHGALPSAPASEDLEAGM